MTTLDIQTPRVFLPLLRPSRYKGAHGGRGSGKSHFFAELGVETALIRPGFRMVCVREVQKSLKESAKRLLEDKIRSLGVADHFRILDDRIVTPGNGLFLFQGMQDHTAESIKSLEGFDAAWVEEAQTMSARSLEMLRPTIRSPGSELWFSWNPRRASDPVDELLRGASVPDNATVVQANYNDNPFFPAELEEERQFDKKHRPDRYRHIWEGDYEPTALGAIWNRQMFQEHRRDEAPEMSRIVVAVDPAVTSNDGSDYHGIVVCGLGADGRGYVLDDMSRRGSPQQWAQSVVAAYDLHDADCVVIEVNQGGDMVRHTLESVRRNIRIEEVRATRGKHVRAEPISALYALGRVSHVGTYPELEEQMCLMTPAGYEGEGSPDRLDALVWAFTELFDRINRPVRRTITVERAEMAYEPEY
ncbi:PBSX family phage terminase large subunit [Thalassospira povalilytica]|uniref:PBSX family phage terminase large subunit n=1 Tax=Thalassospira povalilytica TaxID=732237 RepID=UPI001D17F6C4|nr:PBSX family phage terminase large subunit [Thalassospira povalilytica]MCC4240368.1 PBSX family phage terminase large subunit [Thalassospira povalilytica]|tara:strand:- start:5980 stop:7230 length:1251 start_codon:yes stop_codon:yes gene_type:complete